MLVMGLIGGASVAIVFALWPWLRGNAANDDGVDHAEAVKHVYRARQRELQDESDPVLRAQLEQDMTAVLLSEVDDDQGLSQQTGESKAQQDLSSSSLSTSIGGSSVTPVVWWALLVMIPFVGAGLYWYVGDPWASDIRGAEQVLRLDADVASDLATLKGWHARLLDRVDQRQEDSKSWYLLGHSYLKQGEFNPAAEAFATTAKLVGGDDLSVNVYWLQSRFLATGGQLDTAGRNLAQKILRQNPSTTPVLEMLAMDAVQNGNTPLAVTLLNRALSSTQNPRQQAALANAVAAVRSQLGEAPAGVAVNVALDGNAPPNAVVFVIARPVGGGMPFAVVKQPAAMVPFATTLDDLVSMSEARKLSAAEAFEVSVRLSRSGSAMPQPGDWVWQSQTLSLADSANVSLDAVLRAP